MKRVVTFSVLPVLAALAGCVVSPAYPPPPVYQPYPSPPQYVPPPGYPPPPPPPAPVEEVYTPPPPQPVVSVYVEPPVEQPAPIGVPWAPPPMLVEDPGPPPFYGAVWTGGYWDWQGQWVWAHGRWLGPPAVGYGWAPPYYEHRDSVVVFIPGFWRPPGVVFVAPAPTVVIIAAEVRPGIPPGPPCQGPNGVFVPAPPGSRPGIVVPAPIGTSPAVVVGAPPAIRPGMRIQPGDEGHVRIEAPALAMAGGVALAMSAPREAHLAAAQTPVVRAAAPTPQSATPIRSYSPRQGFAALPQARTVRAEVAQPAMVQRVNAARPAPTVAPPAPPRAMPAEPEAIERRTREEAPLAPRPPQPSSAPVAGPRAPELAEPAREPARAAEPPRVQEPARAQEPRAPAAAERTPPHPAGYPVQPARPAVPPPPKPPAVAKPKTEAEVRKAEHDRVEKERHE